VALASLLPPTTAWASEYRDVQHRSGDLGAAGPDALERVKGLGLGLEERSVVSSGRRLRDPYDLDLRLARAALSWQLTPSLWLALGLEKERRHVEETLLNSRIETRSEAVRVAPAAAFKIMDRLVLGYRYVQVREKRDGGDESAAFYHHAGLRWKGESFELAYDLAWRLDSAAAQRSGGVEARWRAARTLTVLARYERQDTPWSRPPLPYGDVLLMAAGGLVQLDALTLAAEYRNAQQDAADAVVHGFACTADYELARRLSLGLAAARWLTPGGTDTDGATDGRELALRAGLRL
jgi:hypothetical protein